MAFFKGVTNLETRDNLQKHGEGNFSKLMRAIHNVKCVGNMDHTKNGDSVLFMYSDTKIR